MIRVLAILLLAVSQASFSANAPAKKVLRISDISYTDKRDANNFLHLYKLVRKGIINKRLIQNLDRDLSKSSTLKDYRVWSKGLNRIVKANSFGSLKSLCEEFKLKEYSNHIKSLLNGKLATACFSEYLSQLKTKKGFTSDFHRRQNKFFKDNIVHILETDKSLEEFLALYQEKPKLHKLYSKTIQNYYYMSEVKPNLDLVKYLYITPQFTRFLQTKDLESYSTKYIFFRQFRKLKDQTEKSLDNQRPKKETDSWIKRLISYYKKSYEYQPKDRTSLNMLSIGKDFTRAGKYKEAREIFEAVLDKKNKEYKNQAIFESLWTYILSEDYKEGNKYIIRKFLKTQEDILKSSQLAFWVAITKDKIGEKTKSQKIFKDIIENDPLSYYSILSAKKLSVNSPLVANDIYVSNLKSQSREIATNFKLDQSWLKRITLWSELNSTFFLTQELMNKKNHKNFEDHILSAAEILSVNEKYLDSFKIIIKGLQRNYISFSKKTLRILFPTPYLKQIKKEIKEEFDPIIALSLIRQESGFNKKARSRVGARGLMQIMPATARRFKKRLKSKHLYNPNLNISIGTKYFNNLMNRYDNNLVYSLAAYNAGEHRVDRWQSDFLSNDSILRNIENIPYRETRKYVKLIFRNIFFYKLLLEEDAEDKQKFNQIFDLHLGFNR